jgi:hypothetical protein
MPEALPREESEIVCWPLKLKLRQLCPPLLQPAQLLNAMQIWSLRPAQQQLQRISLYYLVLHTPATTLQMAAQPAARLVTLKRTHLFVTQI